jgi:hypothetical protein
MILKYLEAVVLFDVSGQGYHSRQSVVGNELKSAVHWRIPVHLWFGHKIYCQWSRYRSIVILFKFFYLASGYEVF